MAEAAKQGDVVHIHYTGKLDDGTVFDTSADREPLSFTIGEGAVIPGFENAVAGMAPDEEKTVRIKPDDAYGERRDDMQVSVERTQLPEDLEPEVGMQLALKTEEGQQIPVVITALDESNVTLDGNHPLAGQALTFDIKLEKIGA